MKCDTWIYNLEIVNLPKSASEQVLKSCLRVSNKSVSFSISLWLNLPLKGFSSTG